MKTFHSDIFPFNIVVASVKEIDEITKIFVDANGDEIILSPGILGVVIKANLREDPKSAYSLIVFNGKPAIDTLTHEAFHSTCDLLERIGMHLTEDNDETYAYVMGYISKCINIAINSDKIWE